MKRVVLCIIAVLMLAMCACSVIDNGEDQENGYAGSLNPTRAPSNITVKPTQSPEDPMDKIGFISDRRVQYNEAQGQYIVFFGLKDNDKNYTYASGIASITIKDEKQNVLLSKEIAFTKGDFTDWNNQSWDTSRYLCGLYINRAEIAGSTSINGTLGLKVTLDNGIWFEETSLSITSLPEKQLQIMLPELPVSIADYNYSYTSYCEVRKISYTNQISYNGTATITLEMIVTLTGKTAYQNRSDTTQIGYKLFDSDGIVVDSGNIFVTPLAVGESARVTQVIYDLDPNMVYTLKLTDAA